MRVPITLVTGFLGSGKTTLVNKLLKLPEMSDTVVIVNEFGEISIDSDLMLESSDSIVQLANGCLCCSVKGELIDTFRDLTIRRQGRLIPGFNRVLIETTGVADPRPVLDVILSNPMIQSNYVLDGVIVVVDAINGPDSLASFQECVHQVASADCVVITKSDLLAQYPDKKIISLERVIRRLNPSARIMLASTAESEPMQLFGLGPFSLRPNSNQNGSHWIAPEQYYSDEGLRRGDSQVAGSRHPDTEISRIYELQSHARSGDELAAHDHGDIQSVCFVREEPIPLKLLERFLEGLSRELATDILRVKGFACTVEREETPAVVQGAQKLIHALDWLPRWPTSDKRTRIVFIGRGIKIDQINERFELIERFIRRTQNAHAEGQRSTLWRH